MESIRSIIHSKMNGVHTEICKDYDYKLRKSLTIVFHDRLGQLGAIVNTIRLDNRI
jgi:hypothetical protein